ncbi:MAG: mercury transporter MerT [Halobacteriovorax sp.]|nr:mercury transporter MerT [Halobacteriovorax sp.]
MEDKAQKATLVGSVIAALVASACCVGPVIFAVLGISSAGLLTTLEPYRPIVSIITLGLLAFAFYLTYRDKPAKECEEGSYCADPRSNKWNKRILWIATILIVGFLTFPYWSIYLV